MHKVSVTGKLVHKAFHSICYFPGTAYSVLGILLIRICEINNIFIVDELTEVRKKSTKVIVILSYYAGDGTLPGLRPPQPHLTLLRGDDAATGAYPSGPAVSFHTCQDRGGRETWTKTIIGVIYDFHASNIYHEESGKREKKNMCRSNKYRGKEDKLIHITVKAWLLPWEEGGGVTLKTSSVGVWL